MTIPSLQTLHGITRVSVLLLFVIAVFTAQARNSLPEQAANCGAPSNPQAEPAPSTAANHRDGSGTTLVTASARLVLFGVDTFLELHEQNVADDRNTWVPD